MEYQPSLFCEVCGQEFHRLESQLWTLRPDEDRHPLVCARCEYLAFVWVMVSTRLFLYLPTRQRVEVDRECLPLPLSRVLKS